MLNRTVLVSFFAMAAMSFFLLVGVAFISPRTLQWNSLFAFAGYFFLSIGAVKLLSGRLPATTVFVLLVASMFLVQAYTIYLYVVERPLSLPIILVYLSGIVSAYFYQTAKERIKYVPAVASLGFLLYMFLSGWASWTGYVLDSIWL